MLTTTSNREEGRERRMSDLSYRSSSKRDASSDGAVRHAGLKKQKPSEAGELLGVERMIVRAFSGFPCPVSHWHLSLDTPTTQTRVDFLKTFLNMFWCTLLHQRLPPTLTFKRILFLSKRARILRILDGANARLADRMRPPRTPPSLPKQHKGHWSVNEEQRTLALRNSLVTWTNLCGCIISDSSNNNSNNRTGKLRFSMRMCVAPTRNPWPCLPVR
jgi:hypothetical protein